MWQRVRAHPLPPRQTGERPVKDSLLILYVEASVKKIFHLGQKFPWPRPKQCIRCGGRIWGHGFVLAYFDGFDEGLWLRRWRCPDCRAIYRVRPHGYFRRFQSSIYTIRSSISRRLKMGRWPPDLPRGRGGHWLRSLRRHVLAYLGFGWQGRLLEAFDRLWAMGKIPTTRAI